ncbi:MAG: hypothetical protein UU34_C0002G0005 [Candidatus Curtissbacteria bacterium GW2011_GWA1_41_11]|uniref:Uncharacterized protein n=1 Tax=Candidatus Curtissbacteria bacterium GW2011_GWA1_41_11 TaxID=1618409 RepID=A0A0G0UG56_9BACT|nr:MAG: hypothetical protein UU34_C0002G0005 [Candidatus Curtissbacteria bacterium GW2011_GWA1_41_11]
MTPEARRFSLLLQDSIEQEIRCLQEHPESVVAAFDENARVAYALDLCQSLNETASFLSEKFGLGLNARVVNDNSRLEIIDPESMKTRLIGDRPEYVLDLKWDFEGKERSFKLVVADSGKKVKIIVGNNATVPIDSYIGDQLDYQRVHERIEAELFSLLNSDYSVLRTIPDKIEPAPVSA